MNSNPHQLIMEIDEVKKGFVGVFIGGLIYLLPLIIML